MDSVVPTLDDRTLLEVLTEAEFYGLDALIDDIQNVLEKRNPIPCKVSYEI
jgi:hypothetical protein